MAHNTTHESKSTRDNYSSSLLISLITVLLSGWGVIQSKKRMFSRFSRLVKCESLLVKETLVRVIFLIFFAALIILTLLALIMAIMWKVLMLLGASWISACVGVLLFQSFLLIVIIYKLQHYYRFLFFPYSRSALKVLRQKTL